MPRLDSTQLTYTLNATGFPDKYFTRQFSTKERLHSLLGRSITFSLFDVYNKVQVFFLKEMRAELQFEIDMLKIDKTSNTSSWPHQSEELDATIMDHVFEVIALCEYLIGSKTVIPSNFTLADLAKVMSPKNYGSYERTYATFRLFTALEESGIKQDDLIIEDQRPVYPSYSYLEGYMSRLDWLHGKKFVLRSGEATNNKLLSSGIGRLLHYYLCFEYTGDETVDGLLGSVLAANCERDHNALPHCYDEVQHTHNRLVQKLTEIYIAYPTDRVTLAYISIDDYLARHFRYDECAEMFVKYLVLIIGRQRIPFGPITSRLFKYLGTLIDTESRPYDDQTFTKLYKYLVQILTNPDVKDEITVSAVEAFKPGMESYNECLDVRSRKFAAVEADDEIVDDGDIAKSDDIDSFDPTKDPNYEAPASDDEDAIPPEEAGPDDENAPPEEGGDEIAIGDAGGFSLALPDVETLDSFTYRTEVLFIIEKILASDTKDIGAEDLLTLKKLKSQWLYILNVRCIHDIMEKIIKIPATAV